MSDGFRKEPVRFSMTQGEMKLWYRGEYLGQYGDDYVLDAEAGWVSRYSDEQWREMAKRLWLTRCEVAMIREYGPRIQDGYVTTTTGHESFPLMSIGLSQFRRPN